MCVGLALCPIVTACGGSTPRHVAASPAAIAPIVVTQVEVAPVVSEPPVISLGTVGSTLPLEETDLEASSPFFGEVAEGPEVGHVHRWSLADTGALVVVSWLGFREPASDAGDLLPDGPVRVWRSSSRELGLGSTFLASGTRSAHVSVPLVVRATLLAAPRGGSITNIALACRPDDAGCLGADLAGPIDTLARSLRVGPAIGGGTWTLSLPDGWLQNRAQLPRPVAWHS